MNEIIEELLTHLNADQREDFEERAAIIWNLLNQFTSQKKIARTQEGSSTRSIRVSEKGV